MTTDTVPQGGRRSRATAFIVGGMAKGAAMLAPNMATMLAVLTTDAAVEPAALQRGAAAPRVADRFNALVVDGCTSTNDTVLAAGQRRGRAAPTTPTLAGAVAAACVDLAAQMAGDAEGATKVVRVAVDRAPPPTTRPDRAARRWPSSQLVQVLVVRRGPVLGPGRQRARQRRRRLRPRPACRSPTAASSVAAGGVAVDHDDAAVAAHMAGRAPRDHRRPRPRRRARRRVLTNDLTHAYIDENMGTS